ncbi:hypothetical protein [Micromonospora sp. NPDC050695]|uniref:hypothetical protein n=1 Tax=Micromonospora sp. NPDC050695 TaxID=3154938 RepID=UPI0033C1BC2F
MRTHIPTTASDLRNGDLLRIGSSTNYVLIYDAQPADDKIAVTIYSGTVPNSNGATLRFEPTAQVDLSMRNARP